MSWSPVPLLPLVAGVVLVLYGVWAIASGRILSTWGQFAHRPSFFYWLLLAAVLALGIANLAVAVRSWGRGSGGG